MADGSRSQVHTSEGTARQDLGGSAGDLTRFIQWYFDTTIGAKTDSESHRRIATAMALPPGAILFISDVTGELDAARHAGMHTMLSIRPGNKPQPHAHSYTVIRTFDELG